MRMSRRYLSHLNDTIIHKKYFLDSALMMANYLNKINEGELALGLLVRAMQHDNSKLEGTELQHFLELNALEKKLTEEGIWEVPKGIIKDLISEHWKNNRHHPEHFEDVSKMSELDIIEMVCDWHSRSCQFRNDLIAYVDEQQRVRFNFPQDMFQKIRGYCLIISELPPIREMELT